MAGLPDPAALPPAAEGSNPEPGLEGIANQVPQPPLQADSIDKLTPEHLQAQIRWAMYLAAQKAATLQAPKEFEELGSGLLRMAQSIVIMDPDLVAPDGVPIDALNPPEPQVKADTSRSAQNPQGKSKP